MTDTLAQMILCHTFKWKAGGLELQSYLLLRSWIMHATTSWIDQEKKCEMGSSLRLDHAAEETW